MFWRQGLLVGSILAYAVACIVIVAFASEPMPGRIVGGPWIADLVELSAASFSYRNSGEFTRDGRPATAPLATVRIPHPLAIMRGEVTAADFRRCVEAGSCPMPDDDEAATDRPVVKVSWRDARAYAAWLSRETGDHYRLPTDEEWVYAAASRFKDDAIPETDDPGQRALAIYARDHDGGIDREPQPIGTFGANENGLLDVAGNIWEWTDTCFTRRALDARDEIVASTVYCGVRVVEGRHRTYMTDFVRDARSGGCSTGVPPSNLGFRLVRDDDRWRLLHRLIVSAR
ncbi:MAG TPA: SUMF1/EgtB/PvdO family nonheme iron enzyme [Xanthobacteraceae bacterium]|nr:SUMF1/EgtB/PvdO family nonheme iron enzyme [Xanthobacteraceae bacterium]